MSVFVDTGVIYAHADEDAPRHEVAHDALNAVISGELGRPITSDYIYDETVTLTVSHTGRHDLARTVGRRIRGVDPFPSVFDIERITPTLFDEAVDRFERYDDQSLSFTDATTVAIVDRHDIDTVLSFDDDFDGLVDRTPPETLGD